MDGEPEEDASSLDDGSMAADSAAAAGWGGGAGWGSGTHGRLDDIDDVSSVGGVSTSTGGRPRVRALDLLKVSGTGDVGAAMDQLMCVSRLRCCVCMCVCVCVSLPFNGRFAGPLLHSCTGAVHCRHLFRMLCTRHPPPPTLRGVLAGSRRTCGTGFESGASGPAL